MKKITLPLFFLLLILTVQQVFAQNVAINETGATADPSAMLDVQSTTKGLLAPRMTTAQREAIDPAATGLIVFDTDENHYYFHNGSDWNQLGAGAGGSLWLAAGDDIANQNAGNVTIGGGTAEQQLHVFGNMKISDTGTGDGKLFVGTAPADETNAGDYSLLVNGSGIMTELKINLVANWPDYVFSEGYQPMPIDRLADYVQQNKHLPGIPSARQVAQEGGFNVGELQRKMLEKMEELTLYVIDLKKENDNLRAEVETLKGRMREMENE